MNLKNGHLCYHYTIIYIIYYILHYIYAKWRLAKYGVPYLEFVLYV